MDNPTPPDAGQIEEVPPEKARVQARDWLWRPRYAKLWWLSMVVYWAGMALSFYVQPMSDFYSTALAGYLNVCFYPPVILMLLGTGFVRARIRRGDWTITAGESMPQLIDQPIRRPIDPYTDPFDPKSGSLYVGSAESISRVFGKPWP